MRAVVRTLCLVALCHAVASEYPADEARLRNDLFIGYQKDVRGDNNTVISFSGPNIMDVNLDDTANVIEVFGWLNLEWNDPRLQWNKSDYGDIDSITVPHGLLWAPDLAVYNGHRSDDSFSVDPQPLVVMSSGDILWIPPTIVRAICVVDLKMWPKDTHTCNITIGSWTQSSLKVDLKLTGGPEFQYMTGYTSNITASSWEIQEATTKRVAKTYECCPEEYVNIALTLTLRRYSPNLTATVFVPAVCLSLLTLLVFLLHPKAGEKINLGGFCIVLDLIFLIYVASLVGFSRASTPLLVKLAAQQLVMATIGLLASALVLRMAHGPRASGLASCFRRPLALVANCLLLGNFGAMLTNSTDDDTKRKEKECPPEYSRFTESSEKTDNEDFVVLAAVTDRLLFLVFLAVCVNNVAHFWCVL